MNELQEILSQQKALMERLQVFISKNDGESNKDELRRLEYAESDMANVCDYLGMIINPPTIKPPAT